MKLIYKIMCDCQDYIESEGKCFPLLFGRKELNEFVKLFDVTKRMYLMSPMHPKARVYGIFLRDRSLRNFHSTCLSLKTTL